MHARTSCRCLAAGAGAGPASDEPVLMLLGSAAASGPGNSGPPEGGCLSLAITGVLLLVGPATTAARLREVCSCDSRDATEWALEGPLDWAPVGGASGSTRPRGPVCTGACEVVLAALLAVTGCVS